MATRCAIVLLSLATACTHPSPAGTAPADPAAVRHQLEALYQRNNAAFLRYDVPAIMALRAPDFHTITPDGTIRDRAAMEAYTVGLLNGIRQWHAVTMTIDSLAVHGDTALAIVSQHVDREALRPDNAVHHVETWVTQRETWIRSGDTWLLWRVDQLRNQRRIVDGKPA